MFLDGEYKSIQVRLLCQKIYGKPLSKSVFTQWRNKLQITESAKKLFEDEATKLLVYALLRQQHGYYITDARSGKKRSIGLGDVEYEILKGKRSQEWQRKIYSLLFTIQQTPDIALIEPAKGRDLTTLVQEKLGINVHERTIRRLFESWGKTFHLNKTYSIEVVECVIDHFKKRNYRSAKAA